MLWRHGQTVWNAEHRFQGQTDVALDAAGLAQAVRAARLLAALSPDLIVSSDLGRATATAAPLARLTGLPVMLDKDLRERFGGGWEGLTDAEIAERYPAERATWTPPDGESAAAVSDRVAAALLRVADLLTAVPAPSAAAARVPAPSRDGTRLAVVVSHGAAIRLGIGRLLGLPEDAFGVLGTLSNCSWSVVGSWRGRWRLLEHNAGTLPEPVLGDDR